MWKVVCVSHCSMQRLSTTGQALLQRSKGFRTLLNDSGKRAPAPCRSAHCFVETIFVRSISYALSVAQQGDKKLRPILEAAYNRSSDLGLLARLLRTQGTAAVAAFSIRPGNPVRPALAERLRDAAAILATLGPCVVEPKFDGFRLQVHRIGDEVRIFSRNLEEMSAMFPEVTEATRRLAASDLIFEGEVLAYNPATEEFLPFQQTTRRRRKHGVDELAAELPLRLFIFDLLYLNGTDLTPLPYTERRKQLQALLGETEERGVLAIAPAERVSEPEALERFFEQSIAQGLEGIVAKSPMRPTRLARVISTGSSSNVSPRAIPRIRSTA
jgi:DNA ligase-1